MFAKHARSSGGAFLRVFSGVTPDLGRRLLGLRAWCHRDRAFCIKDERPAMGLNLLLVPHRAEELREEVRGPIAEPLRQIVLGHIQILSVTIPPAHHDMRMRVVGVVVVSSHPLQGAPKIALDLGHEEVDILGTIETWMVRHTDHQPKLMRVVLGRLGERLASGAPRAKERRILPVQPCAVGEIAQVLPGRRGLGDAHFHHRLLTVRCKGPRHRTHGAELPQILAQPWALRLGLFNEPPA